MKNLFLGALVLCSFLGTGEAKDLFDTQESLTTDWLKEGRPFWVQLGVASGGAGLFDYTATEVGAGYQVGYLGLDVKVVLGKSSFNGIDVDPDFNYEFDTSTETPNDTAVARVSSDSEANRARDAENDSWSIFLVQPGISVRARFFGDRLPRLMTRARFGVGLGQFTDTVNSLDFSPVIFNTEAGLIYRLGDRSRYGIDVGAAWNWGFLHVSNDTRSNALKRLNVSYVTMNVSLVYAL